MLIPKQVFPIITVASRESTRYSIAGVQIRRKPGGQCEATATDGRRILTVQWDDTKAQTCYPKKSGNTPPAKTHDVTIPGETWRKAGRKVPDYADGTLNYCVLDETTPDDTIHMLATDHHATHEIEGKPEEKHFPTWEDAIPAYTIGKDAVEIGVNPALLGELLTTIARITTSEELKGIRLIVPNNPNKPILITARNDHSGIEATGVMMPIKLRDREGNERP